MICRECTFSQKGTTGQGLTYYICEECGQTGYYLNTNPPKMCPSCSINNLVCSYCGKDLVKDIVEHLKSTKSLDEIAKDIGISLKSLNEYLEDSTCSDKVKEKLRDFLGAYNE